VHLFGFDYTVWVGYCNGSFGCVSKAVLLAVLEVYRTRRSGVGGLEYETSILIMILRWADDVHQSLTRPLY